MKTLLQCINEFIDNVTVTDRQEEIITTSISNLNKHLTKSDNDLGVDVTFTNGSWERETILRPLDDVDIFCVLNFEHWKDNFNQNPNPQSVLSKLKKYIENIHDYKDKVSQSRPCVTIELSKINFDVLPSFVNQNGSYLIPNYDLSDWIETDPKTLTENLNASNRDVNYKLKGIIRAIKSWNRDNSKLIPSYHIEEVAIKVNNIVPYFNNETAIRKWFENAETYLIQSKFDTTKKYDDAISKIKKVKEKLVESKSLLDDKKQSEAILIWKDIFGSNFPKSDVDEAKSFSKNLTEGTLKISSTGMLSSSVGMDIKKSSGFYGEIS